MDDQNKNLILATALSFLVILIWFVMFPPPEQTQPVETVAEAQQAEVGDTAAAPALTTETGAPIEEDVTPVVDVPRVEIDTPRISGSISLAGGRLDDLSLKDYRVSIAEDAEIVKMFSPVGGASAYYALYGWAPGSGLSVDDVPGASTVWTLSEGGILAPGNPVTLSWNNGKGLEFLRQISVDDNYMFTVSQSATNNGDATTTLAPYGILARHGEPVDLKNFFILHEGGMLMADGELSETDYGDFEPATEFKEVQVNENGWVGFTDHYWMATLVPQPGTPFKASVFQDERRGIFQTTAKLETQTLAPGQSTEVTTQLFAGAKEWATIRGYENQGIAGFIDSIDWGWFFFLTKPIFWLLHELNKIIGNMGWAIIGLTLIIKAVLFPLAYKSYVSMAKMKELQPQMEKLKEAAGDDRQKMQQGMMELYKKEKVNPAAGCLPILMQIPIFFSLYKVIFVTIELRQAPFFGPFQDLSAPDPTSLLNFFGWMPWAGPQPDSIMALVFIGIMPLLLGISMWLQQKLNPAPTDATQAMIFAWMPWVFMFMLGSFASGLVVYWIANNTITFTQQYLIMRSQGYKPDVFGNIMSGFKRGEKPDSK
ncbi:MAG: membrane protein insertase YidC [Paracoccaceae bacterium]|jgi:YidC/Oxa1 family membrane protein insertase